MSERAGSSASSDAAPDDAALFGAVYTTLGLCGMAANTQVMPLSSNRQQLLDKIDGLEAVGTLAGHLGVAWNWYTLSPHWSGVWTDGAAAAVSYANSDTRKIAILMAGSQFDTQYDEAGLSVAAAAAVNGSSHSQTISLCHNMKQSGIEIFTIGYGLGEGSNLETIFSDCASEPVKAFFPNSAFELRQAYRTIAVQAIDLHLIN